VQQVPARCGTLLVPENRDTGLGRTIGLRVVVVPARRKPARRDAFAYLAGGPGAAATASTAVVVGLWRGVNERRDIVLVDQRGTGGSHELECPPPAEDETDLGAYLDRCRSSLDGDPTRYGSAAAADDLDDVRAALGYTKLDVYGVSYGATLAQIYLTRHPSSVRTVVLDGGTRVDIPFMGRYAQNGQRALDVIARRCSAVKACARAFPTWVTQLRSLIEAWNAQPVRVTTTETLSGDGLAGVIQSMSRTAEQAASIPLVVSRAAAGVYGPLARFVEGGETTRSIMFWSIWCNERWVGLDAQSASGTYLDGNAAASLDLYRTVCALFPTHQEPTSSQTLPHSNVPLLALVGGADPQDPIGNLDGLTASLPNARIVVAPGQGHGVGQYGCLPDLVARFVARGSARGLDIRCARKIAAPPFVLR
jgi:pimeloyl-ACP methyl ester carboxylesterase